MTTDPGPQPGAWTVRGTDRDEYPDVLSVVMEALLAPEDPEQALEHRRPFADAQGYDRILVATDTADEIVGTVRSLAFDMTLPGGVRRVAGVTGVGVWPTHRRRGVLSALMRHQLADLHAAGEGYAALWASEGGIYGRFGYGPAATETEAGIDTAHATLRADAPRDPELTVRLVRPSGVRPDLETVFAKVAETELGRFRRDTSWWDRILRDLPDQRGGKGPLRAAVVRGADGPVGHALYRVVHKRDTDGSHSELLVHEVMATTITAHVALYEHLFSRDLVTRVVFDFLPQDTPLLRLLVDRQRLVRTPFDSLWLRLVDVPAALTERTYAMPFEATLEIVDRYAPWNAGRLYVEAGTAGPHVEATEQACDLTLDVSHLSAAHLGQEPLLGALRAGLITEHNPGTVARLDSALYRPDPVSCGVIF